jgi:hypothetical protein
MPKFRATLRVLDLNGEDPASAQRALEERLKAAGLRHRILSVESDAVARRRRSLPPPVPARTRPPLPSSDAGGILLVTAVAWIMFMFYYYVLE